MTFFVTHFKLFLTLFEFLSGKFHGRISLVPLERKLIESCTFVKVKSFWLNFIRSFITVLMAQTIKDPVYEFLKRKVPS